MTENIKVAVRVRPQLPQESTSSCITVAGNQLRIGEDRFFAFDHVFSAASTSDDIYVAMGQPLADTFLDGYNASTIAYGQTGAGKTFTMSALSSDVIQEVFCRLSEEADSELPPLLSLTALEIYNETLIDLFASSHRAAVPVTSPASPNDSISSLAGASPPLQLREDPKGGVYVSNLSERAVRKEEELLNLVDYATSKRKTASTLMNAHSSRSHCIVTLVLQRKGVTAKCSFVDLAGSERFKKSLGLGAGTATSAFSSVGSHGSPISSPSEQGSPTPANALVGVNVAGRLREGISINSGLLALGNVIVALCERKAHIPYRSSKLTRVLQPMFGGNSRTAMVACVSPVSSSLEESLNTLKYADRVKSIKTQPQVVVSGVFSAEEAARTVAALHEDIAALKAQLAAALNTPASSLPDMVAQGGASGGVSAARVEAALRTELEEVRAQLEAERKLTRRLKEDLFNAEYTTMVEVEKRKVLEERVAGLEAATTQGSSPPPAPWRQRSRTHSGSRKSQQRASSVRGTADEPREGSESSRGRLTIADLEHQNAEAAKSMIGFTREQEQAIQARDAITRELRLAEARLEQSEVARHRKEEELQRLREEYRLRIQEADQRVTAYVRKVEQAEREMRGRETDIEQMRSLQAKVEHLRAEVQRQRDNARQQQRKASEVSEAHSTEVQYLQRQLREAEEQRSKLERQLRRRDDDVVRARNKNPAYAAPTRSSSAAAVVRTAATSSNTSASATATTTVPSRANGTLTLTPSQQPQQSRGRPTTAVAVHTSLRRASASAAPPPPPSPPHSQVATRSGEVQTQIDAAVTRLEQLERELAELLAYRAAIEETRAEAMRWEKPMAQLREQLDQVDQQLAVSPSSADLLSQRQALQHRLEELQPFERIVAESTQQCEEFTNRIESLMETRRFHTRQVRRLQSQRDAANSAGVPQTVIVSRRRSASQEGIVRLAEREDFSAPPPSVREIANTRVLKLNPRRYSS